MKYFYIILHFVHIKSGKKCRGNILILCTNEIKIQMLDSYKIDRCKMKDKCR